jgi:hypothetical protein
MVLSIVIVRRSCQKNDCKLDSLARLSVTLGRDQGFTKNRADRTRFGGTQWRSTRFAPTGETGAALRPASKFALACSQIIESAMADPALTDVKHRPKPDLSVPAPEVCVLRPLLDRRAAETPNKVFAKFVDGTFWTYRTMLDVTLKTAAALQALGVRQGDHVLS